MILTFEQWWDIHADKMGYSGFFSFPSTLQGAANDAWHARDAEIADLKRQLAERDRLIAVITKMPGSGALDAYVQERVDRAVLAESEWWLTQMTLRGHHFDLWAAEAERLAANRAKVKPHAHAPAPAHDENNQK